MSDPKDREKEKGHIMQALCWNGYPGWLLEGEDMRPLDQPGEVGVEENPRTQHKSRQG